MKISYPTTKVVDQVDNYHGVIVADPFRWLEDVDAADTLDWIKRQNELTFGFLENIPVRNKLQKRLTQLWDYPKMQTPIKRGGRYFQLRNDGLQNQDVLYVLDGLTSRPRVLLDPNSFSKDGTVALTAFEPSPDGKWLAYSSSASGSDWQIWRIRNVDTTEDLPEVIEWSKFSVAAWLPDARGFYYCRYAAPRQGEEYQDANYFQKLYLHHIGTPQSDDVLVYERPDQKEWGFIPGVSEDGHYLVLNVWQGTDIRNRIFYRDLNGGDFIELIGELEAAYRFVGNDGSTFYFRTDHNAPRGCLLAIDTINPDQSAWRVLVPESQEVLDSVTIVNHQFVAVINRDAHHEIWIFGIDGTRIKEIRLPALGSVLTNLDTVVSGFCEDQELFYGFTSFLYPLTIFRYDFTCDKSETFFMPQIAFDSAAYETRQVFATSQDGTQIPLFLTHKKGLSLDGQNPTLLYGYGGFSFSLMPVFDTSRLVWLEMGGVFAQAGLRGGAEYGEEWHRAGMLQNKQNVFNDFIACAEWLVTNKITSVAKLAITGGSNGGLLVGACLTQRPDLFGAVVPVVGVLDMLRFHKFTIGWAWTSDYGSVDDLEQFKTLYAYSPLHNIKPGVKYPPTLVVTGDHDDRVVPGHSFKFTAALQANQASDAPILIRIQTKAGHGFGKPTTIIIEEKADIYAFICWALHVNE